MSKQEYNWFIIKCPCGSENNFINELKSNLLKLKEEESLKEFFIPNLEKPKGKITMGSYVFINAKKSEALDTAIQRISFASYLLNSSTTPATISQNEIDSMKEKQEDLEKQKEADNKLEIGQKILITEGPFRDFEGIVEKIDETTGLISALVSVLGSQLSVKDLPFSSITAINKEKDNI